ncbi:MAG TPA: cupredoxin domain-containing protein [Pyrinomonadaceae bacterium]|nr:cupredoxin domain-containing protein [Pyrinomonadaceae bacterium]
MNQANQANHAQNTQPAEIDMSAEDFTVEFKAAPEQPKAEEQVDLNFTIKNSRGGVVKDLQIVHEKPMHLIVVSEDLQEFFHLHPEAQADGSFKASFAFKNGGRFKLYADFSPVKDRQMVRDFDLTVAGAERAKADLKPDAKFEKTIEDLRVVMKPDAAELTANRDLMLNFGVFDSRTNQPVTDLQKYLGETAHFVIINKDLNEFVHAHPMSTDNVKSEDGHQHSHETNSATKTGGKLMSATANTVAAHVSFPKAGIYKIWAEFQRSGKVTAVPFVVNVKAGAEEKPPEEVKIPEGAIKITVTKDGFTPEEITSQKGKPLKLAFYRADAENCGSQIVFKDLNIKKNLNVGEVVVVDIPTDSEKIFTFACGMNMYKGQIVVQ